MDIPDTLSSTAEYLKQCSMGNTDDPIEVNLKLLQSLEQESQDTKLELSRKCLSTPPKDLLTLLS